MRRGFCAGSERMRVQRRKIVVVEGVLRAGGRGIVFVICAGREAALWVWERARVV